MQDVSGRDLEPAEGPLLPTPYLASLASAPPGLNPLTPARPWQFYDVLRTVLDINVALLACIEHQMLELLYWRVPVATAQHQTYADAIFNAARDSPLSTGRRVAASQVTPGS